MFEPDMAVCGARQGIPKSQKGLLEDSPQKGSLHFLFTF